MFGYYWWVLLLFYFFQWFSLPFQTRTRWARNFRRRTIFNEAITRTREIYMGRAHPVKSTVTSNNSLSHFCLSVCGIICDPCVMVVLRHIIVACVHYWWFILVIQARPARLRLILTSKTSRLCTYAVCMANVYFSPRVWIFVKIPFSLWILVTECLFSVAYVSLLEGNLPQEWQVIRRMDIIKHDNAEIAFSW